MTYHKETQFRIRESIQPLSDSLWVAHQNGFLNQEPELYKQLYNELIAARENNLNSKYKEALDHLWQAQFLFNSRMNSTSFFWRFSNFFGGYIFLYLLAFMISLFLIWFFFSPVLLDLKILWIPSWAFLWGAMGGVLQGFWLLWQWVSYRKLRKTWFVYAISLPLMGTLLGGLAYLIVLSGFMAITGTTTTDSEFFIMLISALAGFSSQWAVNLLNSLTELLQVGKSKSLTYNS